MAETSPVRTAIVLAPGETVEIVRAPCDCPEGQVCPDDGLFASVCPRRPHPEDIPITSAEEPQR